MKAQLYNTNNEIIGEVDLPDNIFNRPWNGDLVHQVLHVQLANKRKVIAHAKTRAEVRGGGKKPWKQKHTGRARHGSIRSPLWKGGGVTFGPTKDRNYSKKINKKMSKAATYTVLSQKLREGDFKFVDSLKISQPKTKLVAQILKNVKVKSVLLIPAPDNKLIYRAASNIPKTKTTAPTSLNVHDLLKYKNILMEKEAITFIK
jgi:large subunit ribosomal protein L4